MRRLDIVQTIGEPAASEPLLGEQLKSLPPTCDAEVMLTSWLYVTERVIFG